ncbi:MAG TPA: pyruvate kinase, partial [Candidatus Limnocylindria bacterium]|nr:pyruvate kinase [Candidatus Limnocylindria bacterium]
MRRTKLICTIGPATSGRIDELVAAGMDVARINFSHGTRASHAAAARAVDRASAAAARPVALLTDLAGPKIRLGDLEDGAVDLVAGERFVLRTSGAPTRLGTASGARVAYRGFTTDVRVGDPIFLADGAAELRVTAVAGDVVTEVVRGGVIRSRAGVAIPALRLSTPTLTARDRTDVGRAIELGATFIGQSFVRSAEDVLELRRLIGRNG